MRPGRPSRGKRTRAAAVGFGLGAALALSPLVWAQDPPAAEPPPRPTGAGRRPMHPQQSFAPLVKRVLPAVVNISVTEEIRREMTVGADCPEGFRGLAVRPFLRRFFDEHGERPAPRPVLRGAGRGRARSGSRWAPASSSTRPAMIVTNNHVVGEAAKVEVILQDGSKYTARARRPRPAHRSRGAEDQGRQAAALRRVRRQQRGAGRRLGDRGRQSRSASAAASRPASSRRAAATSTPASSTTSCRSTRRSTAAIPAARPST